MDIYKKRAKEKARKERAEKKQANIAAEEAAKQRKKAGDPHNHGSRKGGKSKSFC